MHPLPRYVFVDIETTGLDPQEDQIAEIGVVLWDVGQDPLAWACALETDVEFSQEAADVNGLGSGRHREKLIGPDEAREWLHENLAGRVMICNNPAFDHGFLRVFVGEVVWDYSPRDLKSIVEASLGVAPGTMSTRTIGETLDIFNDKAHSALGDAVWVYRCFMKSTKMNGYLEIKEGS